MKRVEVVFLACQRFLLQLRQRLQCRVVTFSLFRKNKISQPVRFNVILKPERKKTAFPRELHFPPHLLIVFDLVLQDDPVGFLRLLPGQGDGVSGDVLGLDRVDGRRG